MKIYLLLVSLFPMIPASMRCSRFSLWTGFCGVFMWTAPYCLWSQSLDSDTSFMNSNKVVIEEDGIYTVSKDIFDTITVDSKNNTSLCYYPDHVKSFWYKIYVAVDSKITFEIFPSNPDNRYNYFLYQKKGNLSIREVDTTNIAPIRANLYEDKMNIGTGVSLSSSVYSNDPCPPDPKVFYHTPYHSAITARAGDVLLLNVYHLKGTDCGHHFILKNGKHSQEFQSIYESCYKEKMPVKKVGYLLDWNTILQAGIAKCSFNVKDSISGSKIDAEVTCVKQCKAVSSTSISETKGSYEAILEKNTAYQITFSALGYENKTVYFAIKDSLGSIAQEILLPLIKAGGSFVMDKIYFYPNTYAMKSGSLFQIDQLAAYLNVNPGIKIEIQGHTNGNKRIKASYNNKEESLITEGRFRGSARKLSQYRADLIKKYLVEKGVHGDRLLAHGYGGSKMIHPDPKNQEDADKNIRVGVLILAHEKIIPAIIAISK